MSPSQTLHKGASLGFSNAAAYDAYRPSYPPAAVETFLNRLRLAGNAEARIVEVAAGTGKFTELLVARPEQYKIIAVEPHEGMRKTLVDKRLGDQVEVVDGFAAKMPVEGEWGDACVVAQVNSTLSWGCWAILFLLESRNPAPWMLILLSVGISLVSFGPQRKYSLLQEHEIGSGHSWNGKVCE
jgi:hypothetical protein